MRVLGFLLMASLLALTACKGQLQTDDETGDGATPSTPPTTQNHVDHPPVEINREVTGVAYSGLRRLSRDEFDNTLFDLLGDESRPGVRLLPEDSVDPFDNDFRTQLPSLTLVEAVEALAEGAARRVLADGARRDRVVGCTPSGADDADCLRQFIASFGRRALRRTLTTSEIDRFMTLHTFGIEDDDFYTAVDFVIQAMLQHPEFLYRVERGIPVEGRPGIFRLNHWEVATRLSYLFWGTTPDDALLDRAQAGRLGTPEEIREAAEEMLEDPRTRERIKRFHAMWLGYHQLAHSPELAQGMRVETDALIERVIFEERGSWLDLFRAEETFVNDFMANHYGLTPPGSQEPTWVSYGESGRRGILSHGSFLSVASKFDDTSPTQRGILIRERLMCTQIPPAPDEVDVDQLPTSEDSPCKADAYAKYMEGGCAGCHGQMDPVGFGLENYDRAGRFRAHDNNHPECVIDGEGDLLGVGPFNGPAELGSLLLESGSLDSCLVIQVFRFALGHREEVQNMPYIHELQAQFRANNHRFDELLLDLVSTEAFSYRMEEPAGGL